MKRALTACLLLIGAVASMAKAQEPDRTPFVAAARLGVTDLGESIAFYERLGCRLVFGDAEAPFAVLSGGAEETSLVLTPASGPVAIDPARCHVRINFLTTDLDRKRDELSKAGVKFVGGTKRSAVGRFANFVDPSGHLHGLKQLTEHPREGGIYNVGIVVENMTRAERFYARLGFKAHSRDYYPPVIPMQDSSGGVPFILSETGRGRAPYVDGAAFAGLAIEVADIETEAARLRQLGVRIIDDEPRLTANVLHLTIADPFGNLHEIIEHVDAQEPAQGRAAPTITDLAWLEGPWRLERGGGAEVLEETWSPATGDAMTGMFRWMRGGNVWLYELMSIEQNEGSLTFRLRHFGRGLRIWDSEFEKMTPLVYPLESAEDQRLVFRNPGRDQPRSIVYARSGDTLTVELLGPDGTGTTFRFSRAGNDQ